MTASLNNSLIVASGILCISVILSKSSNKFNLPILIVFLLIGMIAGSEGIGGIYYEDYSLTHSISLIAICFIIFSGGLMTKREEVRPILKTGISLSTLGVLLTTVCVGVFCHYYLKTPFFESLLIGSILASTDAAAVFTAFRDKNSQVTKNVKSLLEFESGSNDPMAFLLVSIFLGLTQVEGNISYLAMALNPIVGLLGGYIAYRTFKFLNNLIELDFQGLYPALTIGFLFLTYSMTTKLSGNGFLAVYLFALQLGNAKLVHKHALVNFFDGIAWLAQIGLFIMLGLLVFPSRLSNISFEGMAISLFLIFVARPVSVFISTFFSKNINLKSKIFISWAGLKGATPIVFASFVATEVGTEANLIFDIVFFAVLVSAILQGPTLKFMARKLGLLIETIYDPEFPIDLDILDRTKNGIKEISIEENDYAIDRRIVDLNLPEGAIILFIKRSGSFIIPNGASTLQELDRILLVTSDKSQIEEAVQCFRVQNEVVENILPLNSNEEEIADPRREAA